jgi:2-polyprenyl-6-methoxyphenol hydroxylase-like FAD-dependent oxidoreductase
VWDVIVVGARCAGAATALRFARSGRSVLLLDKARAGSDTLSTHVLVPPAVARLDDLGLLDAVRATGAPPVRAIVWEFGGASFPQPIDSPHGYILCVRRTVLDPILVGAAARAGATVRHGARVEGLLWEDGRVVGVRLRDAADGPVEERALLVVGADGRHSVVARLADAPEYDALESESGGIHAYFRGVGPSSAGADALQFASGRGCDALCCPCDGALHVVLLIVRGDEFARLGGQGPTAYEARLRTIPALAPRLKAAERVGAVYRASPRELRGYFRRPFGPGWALAGDAAYHAHPAPANGIADALRAAELLHGGVERAWSTGQPAETHLAEYQRVRDEESAEAFHASFRLGKVNPFDDPELAATIVGDRRSGPAC